LTVYLRFVLVNLQRSACNVALIFISSSKFKRNYLILLKSRGARSGTTKLICYYKRGC